LENADPQYAVDNEDKELLIQITCANPGNTYRCISRAYCAPLVLL